MSARRWWALVGLAVRLLLRSWRWVGPASVMAAVVLAWFATAGGDALPAAALTVGLDVPLAAWATRSAGDVDDDGHRRLLVAASTRHAVVSSRAAAGTLVGVALGAFATAWPLVVGAVDAPGGVVRALVGGLGAHAAAALVGAGVGVVVQPPLVQRAGAAVVLGSLGSMLAVLAALPLLRSLGRNEVSVIPLALAAAAVALAAATFLGSWATARLHG